MLQAILYPTFSEHSYGFRPGRRARDAILAAQGYVQSGRKIVVDVDLEKFFDRVNHAKPQLKVNETESAVADVTGRKFLGYCFWCVKDEVKRKVAAEPVVTFKQRIRQLTRRLGGRSMAEFIHNQALSTGMESLLWAGANGESLAIVGQMVAASAAGNSTQALATG